MPVSIRNGATAKFCERRPVCFRHNQFAVLFSIQLAFKESIISKPITFPTTYTTFATNNLKPFYLEIIVHCICDVYNHVSLTNGLVRILKYLIVNVIQMSFTSKWPVLQLLLLERTA